ncbi:hypothetical protein QC762_0015520 [Podospora pseudocomata]|uniref:Aminoglycoside phosphotransferase domain-containing protein n=1 Tax=Podospora pseudocomata TaxID=2093779 RepID=A0ABR0GWF0_9PEZI|nr:hypothetical protein QC762_0015520 [Podospora pseudocomata]
MFLSASFPREQANVADRTEETPPVTQQAQTNHSSRNYPTNQTFNTLINNLLTLIPTENKDKAQSLAKEIQDAYRQATTAAATSTGIDQTPSLLNLRKIVAKEVRAALRETQPTRLTQPTRTWADIAKGVTTPAPNQPAKVIPARLSREILIKGNDIPSDLAKRNALEAVQAINQASTTLCTPNTLFYIIPPITSDNDLPKLLNTPTKQVKRIKNLVSEHFGSASTRVDRPPMQGMFSRTFFVTLTDKREVVIQFRTEKLDLDAFRVAKGALGQVVPDAVALKDEELENEGVWVYSLERLPGKIWIHGVAGKGAEGRIAVNSRSGAGEAVSTKIWPHLEAILASPLDEVAAYRPLLQGFLGKLNEISKLPLWVSHYDLNDVNILIDETCEVTGLIDWELSTPKPFAVGLGRIHTLAGEYTGGEFWMPDEFEVAERAFWKELFAGMPQKTREMLEKNIGLVQDAVILGTLLNTFFWEDGKVGCGEVPMKALPKFLTYRIPQIRRDEPPYKE